MLQRFLSGFSFQGLDHNLLLLEKQDYIVQEAVFRNCPNQNNSHDCGLFAVAIIWHLLDGKEVHSSVFIQDDIGALREALYRGLSSNAEWATDEDGEISPADTARAEIPRHLQIPYGYRRESLDGLCMAGRREIASQVWFWNSNISESAKKMFNDARYGNWLDAIDGILIKMSLRITKSQLEYEGKDGVVGTILGLATKRWEKSVGCRVYASGNDGFRPKKPNFLFRH
ncbi:hypothetical protein IV203_014817 [Nitzschia inconspicua]|uniref:Uncharacterized protein n=1 Tax=Nitzschia inconspicua TaxID=303405 RepID=A0A9K3LAP2_9STRA|nr:hypothetical protein IV203_014817 [Nitzschia inconspicua]